MNKVKHVEISDGEQVLKIDVDECLDIIYDDENVEPASSNAVNDSSSDTKPAGNNKWLECVTNKIELPKVNFVVMSEYPKCGVNFRLPVNFAKFQEKTEEELDAEIEYDMDEEDIIWLKLINEKRRQELGAECGDPVTQEMFEMLMDRLEKESHFHSSSNVRQQQQQQLTPNKSINESSSAAGGGGVGEDALCCICLDGECMNTNLILFCDICNLAVHQECYGVPYIPEGAWLCRRCIQTPSAPVSCALCPNKYGAFKQTDRGLWVHVICAIWIPEVHFANVVFLEPVIGLENIDRARWRLKCYICRKSNVGACIQCDKQNCYTAFHVTCAQQAGLYLKIKETEEEEETASLSSPKQIKSVTSSSRKSTANQSSTTDEDDEDRAVRKCAYCHLHTPVDVLSPEVRRKIEASMPHGGRHHGHHNQQSSNEYEAALNEAQRNRMKRARKVLKERRNAPVISVPTLAQDRIDAIVERMGEMTNKKELFERLMGYWQNKRHSRYGVPLLKRLQMSGSSKRNAIASNNSTAGGNRGGGGSTRGGSTAVNASPSSEAAASLNSSKNKQSEPSPEASKKQMREKMQGYRKFRQDMEKARLLFELVMKREKIKRELVRLQQVVTNNELNPFNGVFLQGLLNTIRDWDKMTIFAEPVERGVPGYYEAIKEPMDFSTVQTRVDRLYYQNLAQFEYDIRLIFDNCMKFNPKTTIFYKEAHRIRDKARELFKQARVVYADGVSFPDVIGETASNTTSMLNVFNDNDMTIETPSIVKKSAKKSRKSTTAADSTPKKTSLISRSVSRRLNQTPSIPENPSVVATPAASTPRVAKQSNKKAAKRKEEEEETKDEEDEESRDTFEENVKLEVTKKTTAVSRRRSLRSNSVVNTATDLDVSTRSKPTAAAASNKSEEDDATTSNTTHSDDDDDDDDDS